MFRVALSTLLVRWRLPLLFAAIVICGVTIVPASRLQLDRSIESLYADDNPILVNYRESKRLFGGDEFVLVAWREPGLLIQKERPSSEEQDREEGRKVIYQLSARSHARVRGLADRLSRVPGVSEESTLDLAHVADRARSFAEATAAEQYGNRRILRAIAGRYALTRQGEAIEFSRGILLSDDGKTAAIVLRLAPEGTPHLSRKETFAQIREIAAQHEPPAYVAGEPIQVHDAFQYVEEDGRTLFAVSLALLGAVLLILLRSIRWVILPLAVTVAAVLWTRAALAIWGAELSMVSSMLNSMVTIVAVATVAHVAVTYREWRRRLGRIEALRRSIAELSVPIFWNVATTVAGFESLATSDVQPVRSFGIMTALGTGMVLVATSMIVPGGAVLPMGQRDRPPLPDAESRHPRISAALRGLTSWSQRKAALIATVSAVLMVASVFGMWRLEVETDFSKNFRSDSPIVVSLNFIEENLGGAGTWEVSFPAPTTLTLEYLTKVRSLASQLREIEVGGQRPLTKVVAVTDGLGLLPKGIRSDDPQQDLAQIGELQPEFVSSLYNPNAGRMRLMLRARERQRAESKREIIEEVLRVSRETFPDAKVTGQFILLTYVIESLVQGQFMSFSLAAGAIYVMMLIALRGPLLSLVALAPSVLPIALLLGGMGVFGVPVNIGTAMIASVSIGLTIDSSIHYLIAYREARRQGQRVTEALAATSGHVGVALVFANLALSAGFAVLMLSHFVPLIYFGVLVSLAMLGGLLGNLLLLPALVPWVDRDAVNNGSEVRVMEHGSKSAQDEFGRISTSAS